MTGTSCISWNQLLRIPVFTSFFVFSDQNRNLFFFLFYSKRKISWIPAFAGMTSPLSSPKTTPMSSPTWLGIQCFLSFSLLFSFSVIPEINKGESMLFFSLTSKEKNTSWIPRFFSFYFNISGHNTSMKIITLILFLWLLYN